MIHFTIEGRAQPAGSKKAFPFARKDGNGLGVRVTDANPKSKGWQQVVKAAAREAYGGPLLLGGIYISMTFQRLRPKGHYRNGKFSHLVRDSAPANLITMPDLLKLARGVEDALTGTIWRDDAQIISESLKKEFGDREELEIFIAEVGPDSYGELMEREKATKEIEPQ